MLLKSTPFVEPDLGSRHLHVSFPQSTACLSWAIIGGGFQTTQSVVWLEISNPELPPDCDPALVARRRLQDLNLQQAVVFLTSHPVKGFVTEEKTEGSLSCRCVATVGLGNARSIGDPPGGGRLGTINILIELNQPLSQNAMLETMSLTAEARTRACVESGLLSPISQNLITGTGTDCIAVAAPMENGQDLTYAGKHTVAGWLVGETALRAVSRGIEAWTMLQGESKCES